MLLALDKLGRDTASVVVLPTGMKEQFIENATEYFAVLERDIETLTPCQTVDAISILASFQEYFSSTEKWEGLVLKALNTLRQGIYNSAFFPIATFDGICHVAFSVRNLSNKIPGLKNFSESINKLLVANLTAFLSDADKDEFLDRGNYEVIGGLAGPLRYLIDFTDVEYMRQVAEDIIGVLVSRSKGKEILGHPVPGWHFYPPSYEKQFMIDDASNGVINYGLSHGMAGPLAALSLAYAKRFRAEGLEEAIDGLLAEYKKGAYYVNGIVNWQGRKTFEQYIGQKEPPLLQGHMSWCYGSIGILRGIYLAAIAMGDEELGTFAIAEMVKIAEMPVSEYKLNQPIVCHGYAGTAALTNLMYRDTGHTAFLDKTMELLDLTLRYSPEYFIKYQNAILTGKGVHRRASLHDYLEGYSGMLQTVLSVIKGEHNENEMRLLIV